MATTRCETQSKMLRKRKSGKWSFENVSYCHVAYPTKFYTGTLKT